MRDHGDLEVLTADALDRRRRIRACDLCDDDGLRADLRQCDHVDRRAISAAGSRRVRAALDAAKARRITDANARHRAAVTDDDEYHAEQTAVDAARREDETERRAWEAQQ